MKQYSDEHSDNIQPNLKTEGVNPIDDILIHSRTENDNCMVDSRHSPLPELDQLVTAVRLLEIVWDVSSRPSLQWLRKETKRRQLPHIRRGRLIYYRPRAVMEWYSQKESKPATMK